MPRSGVSEPEGPVRYRAGRHRAVRPPLLEFSKLDFLLLATVYSMVGFAVFWRLGLLQDLEMVTFSTHDAGVYRQVAEFLAGRADMETRVALRRPIIYPLVLLALKPFGVAAIFGLQWCANLASLGLTLGTIHRLTGSRPLAIGGACLVILQPTFSFIALHALVESLALAMISAAIFFLVRAEDFASPQRLLLPTFFVTAAAGIKLAYLPFFLLWLAVLARAIFRAEPSERPRPRLVLLALAPAWLQLLLALALTGQLPTSTTGKMNFQFRYFPAVYGFHTTGEFVSYRDPEAAAARKACPTVPDKMVFLVRHPAATGRATSYLLRENLTAGSSFTEIPRPIVNDAPLARWLSEASQRVNRVFAVVHGFALLAWLWVLRPRPSPAGRRGAAGRRTVLFLLGILAVSVWLSSALTYGQGDRLVLAALPAWIVLYPALLRRVVPVSGSPANVS